MGKKQNRPMSGKTEWAEEIRDWGIKMGEIVFENEYACEYFNSMTKKELENRKFLDGMAYDYVFHVERCDRDNGVWVEKYKTWMPKSENRALCNDWAARMKMDLRMVRHRRR